MSKSAFEEKLHSGKFIVTTEGGPPKGVDISDLVEHIEILKDRVDAINVTDHQSSMMRFPSLGGCLLVKEHGGEPVLQMTGRDRNRLALQADLLLAYTRGIFNILCLTGDSISSGDHKDAKPVFDLDSVQILHLAKTLESGKDAGGNQLKGVPCFCCGASVHPEADFLEPQIIKFEKKVAAGAQFFQTQGVFDVAKLRKFNHHISQCKVKILAGIIVLSSARMARYMTNNVPGIIVPGEIIDEMETAEKGKGLAKGIEIAVRLIKLIKEENLADGIHIMAVGNEGIVPDILDKAGLGDNIK